MVVERYIENGVGCQTGAWRDAQREVQMVCHGMCTGCAECVGGAWRGLERAVQRVHIGIYGKCMQGYVKRCAEDVQKGPLATTHLVGDNRNLKLEAYLMV